MERLTCSFSLKLLSCRLRVKRCGSPHDFLLFLGKVVCDVRFWLAQLRYYSFYGRSVVAVCRDAGDVEQLSH